MADLLVFGCMRLRNECPTLELFRHRIVDIHANHFPIRGFILQALLEVERDGIGAIRTGNGTQNLHRPDLANIARAMLVSLLIQLQSTFTSTHSMALMSTTSMGSLSPTYPVKLCLVLEFSHV